MPKNKPSITFDDIRKVVSEKRLKGGRESYEIVIPKHLVSDFIDLSIESFKLSYYSDEEIKAKIENLYQAIDNNTSELRLFRYPFRFADVDKIELIPITAQPTALK